MKCGRNMSAPLVKSAKKQMPEFAKGGKVAKFAMGGAVGAVRKGGSTPTGVPTKKASIPADSAKLVTPKFKGKVGIGGQ